jgi:hypothetical protein
MMADAYTLGFVLHRLRFAPDGYACNYLKLICKKSAVLIRGFLNHFGHAGCNILRTNGIKVWGWQPGRLLHTGCVKSRIDSNERRWWGNESESFGLRHGPEAVMGENQKAA